MKRPKPEPATRVAVQTDGRYSLTVTSGAYSSTTYVDLTRDVLITLAEQIGDALELGRSL